MRIFKKIIVFVVIGSSFSVSANQDIVFSKLNVAINDYSTKIEECDLAKKQISVDEIENDKVAKVILSSPTVLSYLSEKAMDRCLQPQKGMLAEMILYTKSEPKSSAVYKLGLSTQKTVFLPSFDAESTFKKLDVSDQKSLLSIEKFNSPFDAFYLYESALKNSNKAM